MGRRAHDAYYTPDHVARRCVDAVLGLGLVREHAVAVEPSCGGGAFVRPLVAAGHPVLALDIRAECEQHMPPGALFKSCDFLAHPWAPMRAALVIGNPPYKLAREFVDRALSLAGPRGVVAFLLRLAFLEGQKRHPWWQEHRPHTILVLPRRPSFTGDGKTDGTAYAMFVWDVRTMGLEKTRLDWMDP